MTYLVHQYSIEPRREDSTKLTIKINLEIVLLISTNWIAARLKMSKAAFNWLDNLSSSSKTRLTETPLFQWRANMKVNQNRETDQCMKKVKSETKFCRILNSLNSIKIKFRFSNKSLLLIMKTRRIDLSSKNNNNNWYSLNISKLNRTKLIKSPNKPTNRDRVTMKINKLHWLINWGLKNNR